MSDTQVREIPATTEWTEREGTCLGRRSCPSSAWKHLFPVLYGAVTLSPVRLLFLYTFTLFLFFCFFFTSPYCSCYSFLLSMSRLRVSACVCVCVCARQDVDALPPYHHVLARPLNKLMFYGCTATPTPTPPQTHASLKGPALLFPGAFDLSAIDTCVGFELCGCACQ